MKSYLLAGAALLALTADACRSLDDCNGAGLCQQGKCQCDTGFRGENCEILNLGKSYKCHEGGFCLNGETSNNLNANNTWGGSVSYNEKDGKWHMFSAIMKDYGGLSEWQIGSEIAHAVSDTPYGPYFPNDITLGTLRSSSAWDSRTQHNPSIARAPDGTWLLFYMGSNGTEPNNLSDCHTSNNSAACNQRVGLAKAKSPSGPWERPTRPFLEPRPDKWDNIFTTNPNVYIHPNGTTLLIYKSRDEKNPKNMLTGVAVADSYEGPYKRPDEPISVPVDCEDATIFFSEATQTYHAIFHCLCEYLLIWSTDAINWKQGSGRNDWCHLNYTDGTAGLVSRRERPFIVRDKGGKITHISNGVMQGPNTWTLLTELL